MKKQLLVSIALLASFALFAQPNITGTWSGKTVKNGQPMGFKLVMHKNGNFSMAYDLNPNDLSVQGKWAHSNGVLSFKGSDEELQLQRQNGATKAQKNAFHMEFRRNNKKVIYGFNIGMPPAAKLFGWDEGVAAVVINHEEQ